MPENDVTQQPEGMSVDAGAVIEHLSQQVAAQARTIAVLQATVGQYQARERASLQAQEVKGDG